MNGITMDVTLTLDEEALGMASSDPRIQEKYICNLAPDAMSRKEEVETYGVDATVQNGKTIFPKDNNRPFFYDYQIRGMFKDTYDGLKLADDSISRRLKLVKKKIDKLIMVSPRHIIIDLHDGHIGDCQRSLRAMTMQGERVSLANSETVPSGSTISFTITTFQKALLPVITEWLDFGKYRGLGQWRNSGKGIFHWSIDKLVVNDEEIKNPTDYISKISTKSIEKLEK